jgi:hypothetical protein
MLIVKPYRNNAVLQAELKKLKHEKLFIVALLMAVMTSLLKARKVDLEHHNAQTWRK